MSLMMSLDDVMIVLKILDYPEIADKSDEEWLRSELEQKCYMMVNPSGAEWFDMAIKDIEAALSPEEIGKHIIDGDLKKWLETWRDNIVAELVLAKKEVPKGG